MACRSSLRPLLFPTVIGALLVAGASAADAKVTLSDGHVDAGAARIVGGQLRSYVKDASSGAAESSGATPERDPARRRPGQGQASCRHGLHRPRGPDRLDDPAGPEERGHLGGLEHGGDPAAARSAVASAGSCARSAAPAGSCSSRPGHSATSRSCSTADAVCRRRTRFRLAPMRTATGPSPRKGTYRLKFTMSVRTRSGRALSDTATLTYRVG